MNNMGIWVLRPWGVEWLISTNQSESFNAQLKRFANNKEYTLDMMILALLRFSEYHNATLHRARYQLGAMCVRDHLKKYYDIEDPASVMPPMQSEEQYMNNLKTGVVDSSKNDDSEVGISTLSHS